MRASLCCTDLQSWPSNSTPPLPAWGSETQLSCPAQGCKGAGRQERGATGSKGGRGDRGGSAPSFLAGAVTRGRAWVQPGDRRRHGTPSAALPHRWLPVPPPFLPPPPLHPSRPHPAPTSDLRGRAGSRCVPQGCPGDPSREQGGQPLAWQVMQPVRG